MSRFATVAYEGATYSIPEMWLVGQRQVGHTMLEAIALWHWNEQCAAEVDA